MKKKEYIKPMALTHPIVPQQVLLQQSNVPVNPGEEGNQEDAEVRGNTFDFEW